MGRLHLFLPPVEARLDRRQRPLGLRRALIQILGSGAVVREDRVELRLDPQILTIPVPHQA
jgi:hypothetical protein